MSLLIFSLPVSLSFQPCCHMHTDRQLTKNKYLCHIKISTCHRRADRRHRFYRCFATLSPRPYSLTFLQPSWPRFVFTATNLSFPTTTLSCDSSGFLHSIFRTFLIETCTFTSWTNKPTSHKRGCNAVHAHFCLSALRLGAPLLQTHAPRRDKSTVLETDSFIQGAPGWKPQHLQSPCTHLYVLLPLLESSRGVHLKMNPLWKNEFWPLIRAIRGTKQSLIFFPELQICNFIPKSLELQKWEHLLAHCTTPVTFSSLTSNRNNSLSNCQICSAHFFLWIQLSVFPNAFAVPTLSVPKNFSQIYIILQNTYAVCMAHEVN